MEGNKALSDIAHGDKRIMNDDDWEREKTGKKQTVIVMFFKVFLIVINKRDCKIEKQKKKTVEIIVANSGELQKCFLH